MGRAEWREGKAAHKKSLLIAGNKEAKQQKVPHLLRFLFVAVKNNSCQQNCAAYDVLGKR